MNKTVFGAVDGCAQKTTAFECVEPRSIVQYGQPGDMRLVTTNSANPYAYVCREFRVKEVCLTSVGAPTPIEP